MTITSREDNNRPRGRQRVKRVEAKAIPVLAPDATNFVVRTAIGKVVWIGGTKVTLTKSTVGCIEMLVQGPPDVVVVAEA